MPKMKVGSVVAIVNDKFPDQGMQLVHYYKVKDIRGSLVLMELRDVQRERMELPEPDEHDDKES